MSMEKKERGKKPTGGKAVAVAMSAVMVMSQAGYATAALAEELNGGAVAVEGAGGAEGASTQGDSSLTGETAAAKAATSETVGNETTADQGSSSEDDQAETAALEPTVLSAEDQIALASSSSTATKNMVFVYVQEAGYDTAGEKINGTGQWVTIGKFINVNIDDPANGSSSYVTSGTNFEAVKTLIGDNAAGFDNSTSFVYYSSYNKTISLAEVSWTASNHGLKVDGGATDYNASTGEEQKGSDTGNISCWHLDGYINRGQLVVNYHLSDGTTTTTETVKSGIAAGAVIDPTSDAYANNATYTDQGYVYDASKSSTDKITYEGGSGDTHTIDIYYNKVTTADYTVKYVDAAGTTLKDAVTKTGTVGETVKESASDAPAITGYELDANASELSTTIKANPATGENTITYIYNKKTNLSYTVEYYWGTEGSDSSTKIGEGTVVSGQTYGTTVTVTPTAPDGYTLRSADTKTVVINDDSASPNVVKFYCYKDATLVANSGDSVSYDGNDHQVSGYSVKVGDQTVSDMTFSGVTAGTGAAVDAKTYTSTFSKDDKTEVVGSVDSTNMYKVTGTQNGSLTISPRNITLKSESLEKVYDGTPLSAGGAVSVDSDSETNQGWADGEGLVDAAYKFSGSRTVTGATAAANAFTIDWNADGNTAKESNYNVTYEYGSLTVKENSAEYVVHLVQNGSATKVYNGQDQSITAPPTVSEIVFPMGSPVLWTDEVEFGGNESDLVITGKDVKDGGYQLTSDQLTALANSWKVIDSKAEQFPNVKFVIDTPATLTITAQSIAPKGADGSDDPAYAGVTVEAPEGVVYDGTSHQQKPVVKDAKGNELKEGTDYELEYSDDTTDAGTVTVTVKGTGNYSGTVETSYAISKRPVTVTVAGAEKAYDGEPLTSESASVTSGSLADGQAASYSFSGSQTDAGTSQATASVKVTAADGSDATANYDVTVVPGTLTVTAQSIDPTSADYPKDKDGKPAGVTANDPADVVYDGQAHKFVPVVKDANGNVLTEGVDYTVTYDKSDFVNTGTIKVTIEGKGNFSGKIVKSYKITPAATPAKTTPSATTPTTKTPETAPTTTAAKTTATPATGDTAADATPVAVAGTGFIAAAALFFKRAFRREE